MSMPRFRLSLVLTIVCALRGSAQQPAAHSSSSFLDPQAGATEFELVTRALAQNPTLAAVRQEIEMASGGVTQARLRKNPSLIVGGLKEVEGQDNRVSIGGGVSLRHFRRRAPPPDGGQRQLATTPAKVPVPGRLFDGASGEGLCEALRGLR